MKESESGMEKLEQMSLSGLLLFSFSDLLLLIPRYRSSATREILCSF